MSENSQHRKYRRARFQKNIRLFLGSDVRLKGMSNDFSTHSASFFLTLKGGEKYFLENPSDKKVRLSSIKNKLMNQVILFEIEGEGLEPIDMEVLRLEPSWKKKYDIFVGGRFCNTDEFLVKKIEKMCPDLYSQEKKKKYESTVLKGFKEGLVKAKASVMKYEYANSYNNVMIHKDLIALIAEKNGFSESEVYEIRLMADELLMNAFLYGSIEPNRDFTMVKVLVIPGKLYLTITDHAGRVFNDYPYHFRKTKDAHRGGLGLVDEFCDDWQVDTKPGQSTEITICKSSVQEQD